MDLLPRDYFDMIIFVQVLQEINETLLKRIIRLSRDILKPGGMIYIRDHYNAWQPVHNFDIDSHLLKQGFVLEFRPHVKDKKDIWGVPRIWRKIDPETLNTHKSPRKLAQIKDKATRLLGKVRRRLP